MKPVNYIVRIPEPCHEDWNKMQPDEKGKFCSSCSKSVVDFSNKTDVEIKEILLANKDQKMCGHFKKTQVDRPLNVSIDLNNLPRNVSTTKAFAIALFIVFGTLLFSCTNEKNEKLTGIVVEPYTEGSNEKTFVVGAMNFLPPDTMAETIQVETFSESITTSGLVCIHEEYVDGGIGLEQIPTEELLTGDVEVVQEDSTQEIIDSTFTFEPGMVGLMEVETIEPDSSTTDSVNQNSRNNLTTNLITKSTGLAVYPNPSTGEFTVKYDVTRRADVTLDIYDIKGAHVKSVVNITGQYEGKYQVPVNVKELPSGIYMVTLINNGRKLTEKVVVEK